MTEDSGEEVLEGVVKSRSLKHWRAPWEWPNYLLSSLGAPPLLSVPTPGPGDHRLIPGWLWQPPALVSQAPSCP